MEDKLTVAGMGVENRRLMGSSETNFGSCMKLAKDLNCPGTELISVDAKQLIAGAYALYARVYPNDFRERQLNLIENPAERRKASRERSRTRAKSMTNFVIEFS
ncbi:unnamed protein product [Rodentolepis nana]|uniref:Carbam_trans_N domain-containing protein n=1 Tax=Rodentolepis nana TaxID=102285 RepID=A0A0R3TI37_RODNA|nr:unnamed protein product [Rodentolepis nana]